MAQNYTRQSSFADGDTITAALFNNEFNQVVNAFSYSASSDSSTGHKHDGTAGQGGNIPQIGDIDFLNKIVVDNTNNRWGFYVQVSSGTVEQLRIQDGAIVPVTNDDIDLGTSSLEFKDLFLDGTAHIDTLDVDVNATVAGTLGVTGATTLSSTLGVTGATTLSSTLGVTGAITGSSTLQATTITATTAFVPDASDGASLGTSALEFSDLFLADGAVINFGTDQDVSLTHVADTGLLLNSTMALQFNDASQYINAPSATVLDINATDEIELNATLVDVNANLDVSGTVTATGTSVFASLDISGDIDVDGTTNLDVVDIDGAVNIAAATTIATDNKIQFRDTAIYVNSSTDGQLDIVADTEVQIAATTVDINGAVDISGNLDVGGNLVVTGTTTFNGGTLTMGDAATDNVVFGADINSNIIPNTDDTYDLGSSSQEWRNLYIDGTANIDSLVADTADINGGTIDGATIATSDITVGSGKTLNVSAGTLTLADNQISGDKVEGGTIAATTITTLTSTTGNITSVNATTVDTTNLEVTTLKAKDGTAAGSIADSTGVVTLASSVLTTTDINGGTVDGVTIGGSSAGDITYANLSDGTITITAFADEDDMSSDSATLVPTQQSVKAYVDAQVTAQDLDIVGDTGTDSIDLDSETITFTGGTGITSVVTTGTVTHNIDSTVATLTGSQTLTNKSLTAPTLTGTAIVASLDISGDIDVDGTANLDVVDIDGAVDMASTLAVGGVVTANAGIVVDTMTLDAATLTATGDFTVDAVGDIILDADTGVWRFKDAGTTLYQIAIDGASVVLYTGVSDAAMVFKGNDGGSTVTALTLDMSAAGAATFNAGATFGSGIDVTGTVTADGLTVDGTFNFTSAVNGIINNPASCFINIDSDNNNAGESFYISRDASNTAGARVAKFDATGAISFYEDTGTTPKLAWSATNERLTLTGSDYQFNIQQGANEPWYTRAVSDGTFRLHLNGTGDVLTADTSGNVGINTATITSGFKLEVIGDARFGDAVGDDAVELGWSAGGSQGFIQAYDRGASAFRPLNINNSLIVDATGAATLSGTLNGISTTKSASGNRWGILPEVESNGVMEIGRYIDFHSTDGDTSDYGARLDYDGTNIVSTNAFSMASGIYLGGSVAANLLDDYEEGTFTATLKGSTSEPATLLTTTGYYTKIGRNVTYKVEMGVVDTTGYAGNVTFTGFPFANNTGRHIGTAASYSAVTFTSYLIGLIGGGGTVLEIMDIRSGLAWASGVHNAGATRYIWVSGTYQTAS